MHTDCFSALFQHVNVMLCDSHAYDKQLKIFIINIENWMKNLSF